MIRMPGMKAGSLWEDILQVFRLNTGKTIIAAESLEAFTRGPFGLWVVFLREHPEWEDDIRFAPEGLDGIKPGELVASPAATKAFSQWAVAQDLAQYPERLPALLEHLNYQTTLARQATTRRKPKLRLIRPQHDRPRAIDKPTRGWHRWPAERSETMTDQAPRYPLSHPAYIAAALPIHTEESRAEQQWHTTSRCESLKGVFGNAMFAQRLLENLRINIFRSEELSATELLPEVPDLENLYMPDMMEALLKTLDAARQCVAEWMESPTYVEVVAKARQHGELAARLRQEQRPA